MREEIYLVAQADSKHTALMLSNWGTTQRVGRKKIRRVGGELVEFLFSKFQHFYYLGRHGVDDNNCERQGFLSFEEAFRPRDWNLRQFGFVLGLSLANAHIAYEYFVSDYETNGARYSKAEYLRKVAQGLVENEDWVAMKEAAAATSSSSSGTDDALDGATDDGSDSAEERPPCKKMRIAAGFKKWNSKTQEFAPAKNIYQKYRCQGRLGNGGPLSPTSQNIL